MFAVGLNLLAFLYGDYVEGLSRGQPRRWCLSAHWLPEPILLICVMVGAPELLAWICSWSE